MRSRLAAIATLVSVFVFFSYVLLPKSDPSSAGTIFTAPPKSGVAGSSGSSGSSRAGGGSAAAAGGAGAVTPELLLGNTIMPHLGNETVKAELGRASWKLLHTMLARYPLSPTPDERQALSSYIHLFARLYPCGECSEHFRKLLAENPPQTSSRDAASQWGCYVHNLVNERLKKKIFDCGTVTEAYKCGCADAEADDEAAAGKGKSGKGAKAAHAKVLGEDKSASLEENIKGLNVGLEKNGMQRGG